MVQRLRRRRSRSMDLMGGSQHSTDSSGSALTTRSQGSSTRRHSPSAAHHQQPPRRRKAPPKRAASGFTTAVRYMLSSSRSNNHHSQEEKNKKDSELNIFCSDALVSTAFCISRMEYAQKTSTITRLELEDLIERRDQTLFLEVADIILADRRPWQYIRFVDHLYDCETRYDRYLGLKRELWRLIQDDAIRRHIPIQFQAIMELPRGSPNDYVLSFLLRLSDSCDIQSIEFAGAMFGYLPWRIPNELEELCKKGYLRETVVLKVSYKNTMHNTTTDPDDNDQNAAADAAAATLAEDCTGTGDVEEEEEEEIMTDGTELGDNSVQMGKARSVHVLAACIDRLRELKVIDDEEEEDGEQQQKELGSNNDATMHKNSSNHSSGSSTSGRSRRRPKLKRSGTTGEIPLRRRLNMIKQQEEQEARQQKQQQAKQQRRQREKRVSDSSSSDHSSQTSRDVASSLEKLSTMRKGLQRSIQRRTSLEMVRDTSDDDNDTVPTTKEPRVPRKLRIKRSRSIDGSVARTRLHSPPPPPHTMDSSSKNNSGSPTARGNTLLRGGTTKLRRPILRRHKSFDDSLPKHVMTSPGGTRRRMRRPVRKTNSAGSHHRHRRRRNSRNQYQQHDNDDYDYEEVEDQMSSSPNRHGRFSRYYAENDSEEEIVMDMSSSNQRRRNSRNRHHEPDDEDRIPSLSSSRQRRFSRNQQDDMGDSGEQVDLSTSHRHRRHSRNQQHDDDEDQMTTTSNRQRRFSRDENDKGDFDEGITSSTFNRQRRFSRPKKDKTEFEDTPATATKKPPVVENLDDMESLIHDEDEVAHAKDAATPEGELASDPPPALQDYSSTSNTDILNEGTAKATTVEEQEPVAGDAVVDCSRRPKQKATSSEKELSSTLCSAPETDVSDTDPSLSISAQAEDQDETNEDGSLRNKAKPELESNEILSSQLSPESEPRDDDREDHPSTQMDPAPEVQAPEVQDLPAEASAEAETRDELDSEAPPHGLENVDSSSCLPAQADAERPLALDAGPVQYDPALPLSGKAEKERALPTDQDNHAPPTTRDVAVQEVDHDVNTCRAFQPEKEQQQSDSNDDPTMATPEVSELGNQDDSVPSVLDDNTAPTLADPEVSELGNEDDGVPSVLDDSAALSANQEPAQPCDLNDDPFVSLPVASEKESERVASEHTPAKAEHHDNVDPSLRIEGESKPRKQYDYHLPSLLQNDSDLEDDDNASFHLEAGLEDPSLLRQVKREMPSHTGPVETKSYPPMQNKEDLQVKLHSENHTSTASSQTKSNEQPQLHLMAKLEPHCHSVQTKRQSHLGYSLPSLLKANQQPQDRPCDDPCLPVVAQSKPQKPNQPRQYSSLLFPNAEDQSDDDSSSVGILEEVMHNSISFMELGTLQVPKPAHGDNDDDNRSIMELFRTDNNYRKPRRHHAESDGWVGSSSTLTMDGSYSISSVDFAKMEAVLPSSSSDAKARKKRRRKSSKSSKGRKSLHKSASEFEISPSTLRKLKHKKERRGGLTPRRPMTGPLAPHRFCNSLSGLGYIHNYSTNDSDDDAPEEEEATAFTFDHAFKDQEPDFRWETKTLVTR